MLVTIFILYTSIYIQVLNAHKVRRNLKDTFRDRPIRPIRPSVQPVPSNNTFSSFQNGKKPSVNLKPPVPLPTPIKWKEYQLDPLGASFEASLRGIKHSGDSKKAKNRL